MFYIFITVYFFYRWLSLLSAVDRLVEQWEPLRLFFTSHVYELRLTSVEKIQQLLNDKVTKLYFYFLQFILPKFVCLNQLFQGEKVLITTLHEKMSNAFKDFLSIVINQRVISLNSSKLYEIDLDNSANYIPIDQMYLGISVNNAIQNTDKVKDKKNVTEFGKKCQDFVITACKQIKMRYDFKDQTMILISCLSIKVALGNVNDRPQSLLPLMNCFHRITSKDTKTQQIIDDQWRSLPLINLPDQIKTETSVDTFWYKIKTFDIGDGVLEYEQLGNFALNALVIPHSNASCERIFSKVNLGKTKSRNKLLVDSLNGIIRASECITHNKSNCCVNFVPDEKMLSSMTADNLYKKSSDNDVEVLFS